MSCRLTAPSVLLLLFLLRAQRIHSTHAWPIFSLFGFEPPEIDGSPEDMCRIFFDTTPAPAPAPSTTTTTPTPITTTKTTTTTAITKKTVATTKKPQTPPKKPEIKNTGTPIRPQPAPAGPIIHSLLYYLLANGRGQAAGSRPGFNSFIFRPMGGLRRKGYRSTSDSDESGAALVKRPGRTVWNRWRISSLSSEDSSDES